MTSFLKGQSLYHAVDHRSPARWDSDCHLEMFFFLSLRRFSIGPACDHWLAWPCHPIALCSFVLSIFQLNTSTVVPDGWWYELLQKINLVASSIIPYCQHCKALSLIHRSCWKSKKIQLSGRLIPKNCFHQIVAAVRAKAGPCELKVKRCWYVQFFA